MGAAQLGLLGDQVFVNASTGNLVLQHQDEFLAAAGLDVGVTRTYNSQGQFDDDNGDNWKMGVYRSVVGLTGNANEAGSTVRRIGGDGAAVTYRFDGGKGIYIAGGTGSADDILAFDASSGRWTWTAGTTRVTEIYDATQGGRLISVSDADGNRQDFHYGANGLLSEVVDASGETTYLHYDGSNLTSIEVRFTPTPTAAQPAPSSVWMSRVRYEYDSSNRLSRVVTDLSPADNSIADGNVFWTSFSYEDGSKRVSRVAQQDGSSLDITYILVGDQWRVSRTTDAVGRVTQYEYFTDSDVRTEVRDPAGSLTTYRFDAQGRWTSVSQRDTLTGALTTSSYTYDANGNVASLTDGAGNTSVYRYDAAGNRNYERNGAGDVVERTFGSANQVLNETRYFVADADGDGAALPSGASTTRFVYDSANRLRFTASQDGRLAELRYDARGQRTAEIRYVINWSSAAWVQSSTTEADVVAWLAQAPAAERSMAIRTDYAYDARGLLAESISYAKLDGNANGILDGNESRTRYVYDQAGQLLQRIDARQNLTSYAYDGMGRQIAELRGSAMQTVSTVDYNGVTRQQTTRRENGSYSVAGFDASGRLVRLSEYDAANALIGSTEYSYDAAGHPRMVQGPDGNRHYAFHDALGRKIAEVDGDGSLTEYRYDGNGLVVQRIRHREALSVSALLASTGLSLADLTVDRLPLGMHAGDEVEHYEYDKAGRLAKTLDAGGYLTENRYNGLGTILASIRYAALQPQPTNGKLPSPVPNADNDRIERTYYNRDGMVSMRIDASGYATQYEYNSAGQLYRTIWRAIAFPASTLATFTYAEPAITPTGSDIYEYRVYDSKGQLNGIVDGESYLTEFTYNANGQMSGKIRYSNRVAWNKLSRIADLRALAGTSQMVAYEYNARDQLSKETAVDGTVTTYTYDHVGELVATTRAAGTVDARSQTRRVDSRGLVIAELDGEGSDALAQTVDAATAEAMWQRYAVQYSYDAAGRRISATDANGLRTLLYYDADGRLALQVNPAGEAVRHIYDSMNRLVEKRALANRVPPSTLAGMPGGQFDASLIALLSSLQSVDDQVFSYGYDSRGLLNSQTDALGFVTTTTNNAFGEVEMRTTQIDRNGRRNTEKFVYDRRGLQTIHLSDDAVVRALHKTYYDFMGRVRTVADAQGNSTDFAYDRIGRQISVKLPLHTIATTTYDAFDRVLATTDGAGTTTRTYDLAQRSYTVTTPEGIRHTVVKNRHGQQVMLVDGNGYGTVYTYDLDGRLVQTTDASGREVKSSYDVAGRIETTTDANGIVTEYTYDAANRVLTRTVDPQGMKLSTSYTYDPLGRVATETDARGVVTRNSYDAKGQLKSVTVDAEGTDALKLVTSFEYDGRGKVLQVTDPAGLITEHAYDNLGRRISETVDPAGAALRTEYYYDQEGNLIGKRDASQVAANPTYQKNLALTSYVYDGANRLATEIDASGAVTRYEYDVAGRLVATRKYANAIDVAAVAAKLATVTPRTIWSDGRALAAEPVVASAADQVQRTVYDKDGRARFTIDGAGGVTAFEYDGNNNIIDRISYAKAVDISLLGTQPTIATVQALLVDSESDQREKIVYDTANRAIAIATAKRKLADGRREWVITTNSYDANGNVLHRRSFANLLTAAAPTLAEIKAWTDAPANASTTDAQLRFAYDAANRQIASASALGLNAQGIQEWAVTRQSYDTVGHLLRNTEYATAKPSLPAWPVPDAPAWQAWLTSGPTESAADRVARYAYDDGGRRTLAVDAGGAVTRYEYDRDGRQLASTRYADVARGLTREQSAEQALQLLVADPLRDRRERYAYDSAGRLRFAVDAMGYVKETRYDALSRITASVKYPVALSLSSALQGAALAEAIAPTADAYERQGLTAQISYTYDAAGNLASTTDEMGKTESYVYDAVHNRVRFNNKLNRPDVFWSYSYDAAGRLIAETSPTIKAYDGSVLQNSANPTASDVKLVTRIEYDAHGNVTSRIEAAGEINQQRTTRYIYDAMGRQVQTVLPSVGIYDTASGIASSDRTEKDSGSRIITVSYDALGNAVSNTDMGGKTSFKVYDRAGRVRYEVDALKQVTAYERNAFGDVIATTRYSKPANDAPAGKTYASMTADDFRSLIVTDPVNDRTLRTTYDQLGRVVQVREPVAAIYDQHSTTGSAELSAGRVTETEYDALGNAHKVSVYGAKDDGQKVTESAVTYHYYNLRGEKRATVQALSDIEGQRLGYATFYDYDAAGNLQHSKEFAQAYSNWNADTLIPPDETTSQDRHVYYTYDKANRLLSETRIGVTYAASSSESTPLTGNLTTQYEYDALGNRTVVTDALKGSSYTYYDVLGRTVAVGKKQAVEQAGVQDGGATLTEFRLDIHGNVVQSIARALSPSKLDASGYAAAADNTEDRITVTRYDAWGRALEVLDAQQFAGGRSAMQFSYDIYSRVAKQWRTVSDADGRIVSDDTGNPKAWYQITKYDDVGRVVEVVTPELDDLVAGAHRGNVRNTNTYNAFGEITKSTVADNVDTKVTAEVRYDQAGHAWLSNSGDGVWKVMLYDTAGNTTSVIRSATTDLSTLKKADDVKLLGGLLRTDTKYDLLGHQQETTQYSAAVALVRKDSHWERQEAFGALPDGGLLIVGDLSDAEKAVRVRYRKVGDSAWADAAPETIKRIEGTPVFNTASLNGTYEYEVLVRAAGEQEFVRSGGKLEVKSALDTTRDRQIIQMYMMLFGRAPAFDDLKYWIDGANKGMTNADLLEFMLRSPEAIERYKNENNRTFIAHILNDGFGIPSSTDAAFTNRLDKWTAMLDRAGSDAVLRAQVVADLLNSMVTGTDAAAQLFVKRSMVLESYLVDYNGTDAGKIEAYRTSGSPDADLITVINEGKNRIFRGQVAELYISLLGRAPNNAEVSFYANNMLNGSLALVDVARSILTSTEAQAPDLYPPANGDNNRYNATLVDGIYFRALGRAATTDERNAALSALNSGTVSAAQYVVNFAEGIIKYDGADGAKVNDRNLLANKVAMVLAVTQADQTSFNAEVGKMLLQSITATASSQDAVHSAMLVLKATADLAAIGSPAAIAANSMPVEATRRTLARLYITLLGRVPDKAGMDAYLAANPAAPSAAQWEGIALAIMNSGESAGVLGNWSGLTATAFVDKLYSLATGTVPTSQAAINQKNAFVQALSTRSRASVAVDIARTLFDVSGLNAADQASKNLFDTRTAVAVTVGMFLPLSARAELVDILGKVTANDTTAALNAAYAYAKPVFAGQLTGKFDAALAVTSSISSLSSANAAAISAKAALDANADAAHRLKLAQLYVGILGRDANNPPDIAGMQSYVNAGASLAAVAQDFVMSAEASAKYANTSDSEFVKRVFTTMLGGTSFITQQELDMWTAKLSQAQPLTRGQLALDIMTSVLNASNTNVDPANAAYTTARHNFLKRIDGAYATFDANLSSEVAALNTQLPILQQTAGTASSALTTATTNLNNANSARDTAVSAATSALNNATAGDGRGMARLWVVRLYAAVLQRDTSNPPSLSDVALYQPYSESQVAQWLLDSAEGRTKFAAGTDAQTFVNELYKKILGRTENPTAAESATYVNFLNANATSSTARGQTLVFLLKDFLNYSEKTFAGLEAKRKYDEKVNSFLTALNGQASTAYDNADNRYWTVNGYYEAQQYTYGKMDAAGDEYERLKPAGDDGAFILDHPSALDAVSEVYGALRGWADYAGALAWIKYVAVKPAAKDELIADMLRMEYTSTNYNNVAKLFDRILHSSDSAGITWYANNIDRGATTLFDVAKTLLASGEAQEWDNVPASRDRVKSDVSNIARTNKSARDDAYNVWDYWTGQYQSAVDVYRRCGTTVEAAAEARRLADLVKQSFNAITSAHALVVTADAKYQDALARKFDYDKALNDKNKADAEYKTAKDKFEQYSKALSLSSTIRNATSTVVTVTQHQSSAAKAAAETSDAISVLKLTQIYTSLLNRPATGGELLRGLENLKATGSLAATAGMIIAGNPLLSSMSDDAFVGTLYSFAFGRTAQASDKQWWVPLLTGGMSRGELVSRFIAAANDVGNSDTVALNTTTASRLVQEKNAGFTNDDIHLAILGATEKARTAAANGDMAALAELQADPAGQRVVDITRSYMAIFGRVPDPAGLVFYVNQLASNPGLTLEAINQAMITSLEGLALYPNGQTAEQFITTVFNTSFGRPPTPAELGKYSQSWSPANRGMLVQSIVKDVIDYVGSDLVMLATQAGFNSELLGSAARLMTDAAAASVPAQTAYSLLLKADQAGVATLRRPDLQPAIAQSLTSSDVYRNGTVVTTDRWGNVLTMTDPRNPNWKISYRYNQNGQQVDQTQYHMGAPDGAAHSETRYDALGRVVAQIDARGNKTAYGYDSNGNVVKEYRADGKVATSTFNLFGNRIRLRSADSVDAVLTDYGYDHMGRLTSTETQAVEVSYPASQYGGNTYLDSRGYQRLQESYAYDELGRQIAVRYREFSGDADDGNVTSSDRLKMRLYYDAAGNVIRQVNGAGFATLSTYDALGFKIAERDGAGKTMSWTVNAFGRVLEHVDKGNTSMSYNYNALGQQTHLWSGVREQRDAFGNLVTTFGAQDIEQVYENGLLVRIIDRSTNVNGDTSIKSETRYTYDAAGRHLSEQTAVFANGIETLVQDNRIRYDAQGRMSHVEDGRFTVDFDYDNNGNRISVATSYKDSNGNPVTSKVYSSYDAMNRALVINGDLEGETRVAGKSGHKISYDASGRRATDSYQYRRPDGSTMSTTETFIYDSAGRLFKVLRQDADQYYSTVVEHRYYDEQGRVVRSGPAFEAEEYRLKQWGIPAAARVYAYDSAGNLERMKSWNLRGNAELDDVYYRSIDGQPTAYDGAGTLHAYTIVHGDDDDALYNNSYAYFDSAKEVKVTGMRGGKFQFTQTVLDANGNVIEVIDKSDATADKSRQFVNDAFGRVLRTTEGSKVTHTMIVNGEVFGNNDAASDVTNFASAYQSGTSTANLASPTVYTVQSAGETLSSIAKAIWGDSSLWYLIADANSLAIDTPLTEGQMLRIPGRVNVVHNDADTFLPYNPAEAIGDTRPTLPAPPGGKGGCGGVGQIIMIVVAVIVTIYTAGAASGIIGAAMSTTGSVAAAAGAAVTSVGTTFAAGVATLTTATLSGTAIASAAIGAAVGSIVSQGVGMAIGVQDKMNWKSVGLSAMSAGVGVGVSGMTSQLGSVFQATDAYGAMARAALSSTVTQGIGVATGLQNQFSWRNVAASAAGAAAGEAAKGALGLNTPNNGLLLGERVAKATLSGFAAGTTAALMRGGKLEVKQIATDAFGNAIGSSFVDSISRPSLPSSMRNLPQEQQDRMLDMAQKAGLNAWSSDEKYDIIKRAADLRFNPNAQNLSTGQRLARTNDYLSLIGATDEQISAVNRSYTDAGIGDKSHWRSVPQGGGIEVAGTATQTKSFLGTTVLDDGVIGVGNVITKFGQFVDSNPIAKYALEGLDIVSGPVMYGVRHIPAVESLTGAAIGKISGFFGDGFSDAGRIDADVQYGAVGGTSILSVGATGFAGSIKVINNLTTDIKAISSLSRGEALRQKHSHLSSQERRAVINDRLESIAANRLKTLEQSIPGAHFQARHGAQTTLQQQYDRAIHGVDPATGQIRYRNDGSPVTPNSTRFMSNRDQINAIERATSIFESTGRKVDAEKPIVFKTQAGEGYYGGTGVYDTSFSAQVWFNNARQPITAFPILGR